jgi:hypothetical protein
VNNQPGHAGQPWGDGENQNMKTAERAALDFALTHIERHGDTEQSTKATQHRLLLAQEHEPSADATGDSSEFAAKVNAVVFGKTEAEGR